MTDHPSQAPPARETRPTASVGTAAVLVLLAFALTLGGPWVYTLTLDNVWLRSSGASAFLCMFAGIGVAFVAARRLRRLWTRLSFWTTALLTIAFAYAFFWWARLPESDKFEQLADAPGFTLTDQSGARAGLYDNQFTGPTLLVFYRGFW